MPDISVIVPVFDMEIFLRQCVQSVLAQTFHDWELILVDDGSTDSSGSICDEAAISDSRIHAFHIPNCGPASARNFGLDKARGEYIAFADADDLLHPHALEYLLRLAQGSKMPLAAGEIKSVKESFSLIPGDKNQVATGIKTGYRKYSGEEAAKRLLYQRGLDTSVYGKIYHRSLFDRIRFRAGIIYEDLDMLYRLVLVARGIAVTNETVYYHRHNPGSLLHLLTPERLDVLKVTHGIEEHLGIQYPQLVNAARARRLAANFNIMCEIHMASIKKEESAPLQKGEGWMAEADSCWEAIKELRCGCLKDPNLRIKDRLGIVASYAGGRRLIEFLARFIY